MLRSLFSAVSGMRAHQTKMDTVGNNIANVNTTGYKSSDTVFEDTLSQMVNRGGQPAAGRGGQNVSQVGLGVKIAGIATNFTQGSAQATGRSTDMMISGDGFFVVRQAGETLFTRSGAFSFDGNGFFVTADGATLQGYPAVNGVVDPNAAIGNLRLPFGSSIDPVATTAAKVMGNLPATDPVGGPVVTSGITMYDDQGKAHQVVYSFSKTGPNAWQVDISDNGVPQGSSPLTFDSAGKLTAPAGGTLTFTPTPPGEWTGPVTIDLSEVTQFGGTNTIAATEQNGSAAGLLQSFGVGTDGTVVGTYSNGLAQDIGRVVLAGFANPGGLEKAGNSTYRAGFNSGAVQIGSAGTGGRGSLTGGALEMSNVDLAQEFTSLIVAQRGFQANSRVISASDEILQDVVNLKR